MSMSRAGPQALAVCAPRVHRDGGTVRAGNVGSCLMYDWVMIGLRSNDPVLSAIPARFRRGTDGAGLDWFAIEPGTVVAIMPSSAGAVPILLQTQLVLFATQSATDTGDDIGNHNKEQHGSSNGSKSRSTRNSRSGSREHRVPGAGCPAISLPPAGSQFNDWVDSVEIVREKHVVDAFAVLGYGLWRVTDVITKHLSQSSVRPTRPMGNELFIVPELLVLGLRTAMGCVDVRVLPMRRMHEPLPTMVSVGKAAMGTEHFVRAAFLPHEKKILPIMGNDVLWKEPGSHLLMFLFVALGGAKKSPQLLNSPRASSTRTVEGVSMHADLPSAQSQPPRTASVSSVSTKARSSANDVALDSRFITVPVLEWQGPPDQVLDLGVSFDSQSLTKATHPSPDSSLEPNATITDARRHGALSVASTSTSASSTSGTMSGRSGGVAPDLASPMLTLQSVSIQNFQAENVDPRGILRGLCSACSECDGYIRPSSGAACDYCGCVAVKHEKIVRN